MGRRTLSRQWLTAAEIAALRLPELPTTERAVQLKAKREGWHDRLLTNGEPMVRRRQGKGGGWEYHYGCLPAEAQRELVRRELAKAEPEAGEAGPDARSADAWAWFERLPERRRAVARQRLKALLAVEDLIGGGLRVNDAVCSVAQEIGVSKTSIYQWRQLVAGLARSDWLPALAPRHTGRIETAEITPEAWDYLLADYLTTSRPPLESSIRRLQRAAAEHGWTIPSPRTLARRIAELPRPVVVLKREGVEALRRLYPAQERDRSSFHALEAVNADGHQADVFVRWPGETIRPVLLVIQDLYSGAILAWRVGPVESAHLVQLAFGDLFRDYGIPTYAWLDNGRGFASKWITGQQPTRYRFQCKPSDPAGILTQLGVEVHWTTPYSGQSKPIERGFRDLCSDIWRHPAFAGAYTGPRPDAKPEDYGSRAVPLDDFLRIVSEEIRAHNARTGRRTRVCGGTLSFDQAFRESYERAPIRRASDEQLRMFLLAAESVTARKPAGAIHLLGNRYWADFLTQHVGQRLIIRFDPDALHDGVHVERLDGVRLGFAPCWEAAGFRDIDAARAHARARRQWLRGWREMTAAEVRLTAAEAAKLLPTPAPEEPVAAKVIRPIFGGNTALAVQPEETAETIDFDAAFSRALRLVREEAGPGAGEE